LGGPAEAVLVSPISFYEIGRKVRLGKWPEMEPFVARLPALVETQGGRMADRDGPICLTAATMDWARGDPFDRLLAATALQRDLPIVSADGIFDTVVTRVWWSATIVRGQARLISDGVNVINVIQDIPSVVSGEVAKLRLPVIKAAGGGFDEILA
jgi:PIN domain nuclease of toxin-antitoxin system